MSPLKRDHKHKGQVVFTTGKDYHKHRRDLIKGILRGAVYAATAAAYASVLSSKTPKEQQQDKLRTLMPMDISGESAFKQQTPVWVDDYKGVLCT